MTDPVVTARTESVWDYPRPPRLEPVPERIRVVIDGITVADTTRAFRVLETSHPPSYYLPPEDIRMDLVLPNARTTACEWKGGAAYHDVVVDGREHPRVAWSYPDPSPGFEPITGYLAFYAGRVDEAWVGDELAMPQEGDFYGGWITSRVTGPFKGGPGSMGW